MKTGKFEFGKGIFLAPMEGVTDQPFRILCKRMGADLVYTEFIASEGLIRDSVKSFFKLNISDEERPVAVQIFGSNAESLRKSAKIAEDSGADILDINFGCWVPKVIKNNAGAALLREPEKMAELANAVAEAVSIPVTVKTRLGWDRNSINIVEISRLLQNAGVSALAVHCRTRDMGLQGEADWSWIKILKDNIEIPVILNGDVRTPEDAKRAFVTTSCDAVMIGRAAIGNPFIFREIKEYIETAKITDRPTIDDKLSICLEHLRMMIEYKGLPRGLNEFRKHFSGYLKGMYNSHPVRQDVVVMNSFEQIEERLMKYREETINRET